MRTKSLTLVLQSIEETLAAVEALSPADRTEVSADWLARVRALTAPDPWTLGFSLVHRDSDTVVGSAGFTGPPTADGVVEISYGVDPAHQGRGYATEAAQALTAYAFGSGRVRRVRAHTRPEPNASTRVLAKCGFQRVGEVIDPNDGLVWRWEKDFEAPGEPL